MPDPLPPETDIENIEAVIGGRRIRYLKAGTGNPVVLLHGGASDSREWRPIMTKFADRFSFYAPDLPGFGASDRDPKGYYLTDYAEFLRDFINHLKLEKTAVAGHSFGGQACLEALRLPGNGISKAILIDSSGLGKMSFSGRILFDFFKYLRAALVKPQPFPTFLAKEGVDWNYTGDEALKSISVPVLLIWKRTDPYLPLRQARRAQSLIPGAKLVIVSGYGHAPHQQKDNSEFGRLMAGFLEYGNDAI